MDLLEELGIAAEDRDIFRAVKEHLSYAAAATAMGIAEGRLKHRFFKTCIRLERDKRGRPIVNGLMQQLAALRMKQRA